MAKVIKHVPQPKQPIVRIAKALERKRQDNSVVNVNAADLRALLGHITDLEARVEALQTENTGLSLLGPAAANRMMVHNLGPRGLLRRGIR